MTDHLSPSVLNGLVDGELSPSQVAAANEHLAVCPACTSDALHQSLLKSATARAGQRHTPPSQLQERLTRLASQSEPAPALSTRGQFGAPGWIVAAVLLLVSASTILVQRSTQKAQIASVQHAAVASEVFDQHLATLAGNLPPQVLSTDRHTVKPWFQGKLPFSFNLPETLPADTRLDGANLTYLHNQPVAQLLYSIGNHRVSVFVSASNEAAKAAVSPVERSGFHVMDFRTRALEGIAISDVDPARLAELVNAIKQAQTGS
jgi:anti-sigma factor RsiW